MNSKRKHILAILFLVNTLVFAQWSTDPNNTLEVSPWGWFPEACTDGKGGAYIVWLTYNYEYSRVYLQYVDRYGYLQWENPLLIGKVGNFQSGKAHVVPDGEGGVYVGYDQMTPKDTIENFVIWDGKGIVQRVDSNGTLLWGVNGLRVCLDTINQRDLGILTTDKNELIANWVELIDDQFTYPIALRAQKIDKFGTRLWEERGKFLADIRSEELVVTDNGGGFIAQYTMYRDTFQVVTKFNEDGNMVWERKISNWFNKKWGITSDGIGGAVLSCVDVSIIPYRNPTAYALDSEGNWIWGESGVVLRESPNGLISWIKSTVNENGNASFFWNDTVGSNKIILTQTVTRSGEVLLNDFEVSKYPSSKYSSFIVNSENNSNIFIWGDNRMLSDTAKEGLHTYSQRIEASGYKLWDEFGEPIYYYRANMDDAITDTEGGLILVSSHPLAYGVYAQQLNKYGILGEVITDIDNEAINISHSSALSQNYPNPFNPSTTIKYSIPKATFVTLKVYDVLGREVATLVNEYQKEGKYKINFNAKNLPSGIYIYSLRVNDYNVSKKMVVMK